MKNHNVCIITTPISHSGVIPLSNLTAIYEKCAQKVIIITSSIFLKEYNKKDTTEIFPLSYKKNNITIFRIFENCALQIKITIRILKSYNKYEIIIFFIGGELLILPMIISKILRKKSILLFAGSEVETAINKNDPTLTFINLLSKITKTLCNYILIYSPVFIKRWNLAKYQNKIIISHRHFINFSQFTIFKPYYQRSKVIGYLGRLSEEKGILNFMDAIPKILKIDRKIVIHIYGDGPIMKKLQDMVTNNNFNKRVIVFGWVSHDELPKKLNEMKLLIIPSYTEGLPNIMIEAFACGTPVLASKVGAITDFIIEKQTGFLLENNSPDMIFAGVKDALNYPYPSNIIAQAIEIAHTNFDFDIVAQFHKKIIEKICQKKHY